MISSLSVHRLSDRLERKLFTRIFRQLPLRGPRPPHDPVPDEDCQTVDACGTGTARRMANQAFFTRIYLHTANTIRADPTPSFGLLLDPDTQQQAVTWANKQPQAGKRPTRILIHHVEGSSKTRGVGRSHSYSNRSDVREQVGTLLDLECS